MTTHVVDTPSLNMDQKISERTKKNTLLMSHGRPPWYGEDGIPIGDAFVVGIAGGSASGKVYASRYTIVFYASDMSP